MSNMKYSTGYCQHCRKQVKIEKAGGNYNGWYMLALAVVIGIFTGGVGLIIFVPLWVIGTLFVWMFSAADSWKCCRCGQVVEEGSVAADYGATETQTDTRDETDRGSSEIQALEKLASLKERGAISEEEFAAEKKKIIG